MEGWLKQQAKKSTTYQDISKAVTKAKEFFDIVNEALDESNFKVDNALPKKRVHEMLYKDFSCFEPKRFQELKTSGIPEAAISNTCDLLGRRVKKDNLSMQLDSFSNLFPGFAISLPEEFDTIRWDANGAEVDVATYKQSVVYRVSLVPITFCTSII